MIAEYTLLDMMEDADFFGPFFEGDSWNNWKVFLKALFCIPMSGAELEIFQQFTGRTKPPAQQPREAFVICGMGAGKTRILSTVATFLAVSRDYSGILAPGQRLLLPVIAADQDQAGESFRYISGLFDEVKPLKTMVEGQTKRSIDLENQVTIEVKAANFRTIKGRSRPAALCDELAFWRSEESANPDREILNALRRGLGRVPGSLLLAISSPYAKRGELWHAFDRHYGEDDSRTLVWKASTFEMNPVFDQEVIAEAYEADPQAAAADYGAEWRSDLETYVSTEVVNAATFFGRFELLFTNGLFYFAFVDPSGGSSDSFTLSIAHSSDSGSKRGVVIQDLLLERRPPFSPSAIVAEYADALKRYRCSVVTGDAYAGMWPRDEFAKHGITYKVSDKNKSQIYQAFLPLLNSGRVELLDNNRQRLQLCALERKTSRASRDIIDHPPKGKDDCINAGAGSLLLAATSTSGLRPDGSIDILFL